ncbi:hypothetical protein F0L17_26585 [Streptomyces sp. TRM43335]|uniref:Uncharacterized protein n=1 Tax=Streptomyces taklimakanensis TaxID=2569853 RepID=A0A6G2BK01_9ACTN|nr:hypothetical protein [Streptomyces taklimakanensis]MTE22598.1 hypothetical protein [Streptomyces taklimakanensis]
MPSEVLSTRLTPRDHDRLRELAERRGKSLSATASELLSAALADPDAYPAPQDGALVDAVRATLAAVTAPEAVIHREVAIALARAVERREAGYLSAAGQLRKSLDAARSAQRTADRPPDDGDLDSLLAMFGQ